MSAGKALKARHFEAWHHLRITLQSIIDKKFRLPIALQESCVSFLKMAMQSAAGYPKEASLVEKLGCDHPSGGDVENSRHFEKPSFKMFHVVLLQCLEVCIQSSCAYMCIPFFSFPVAVKNFSSGLWLVP